eukprot:GILI01001687.1.p1 GENE.GILI01001687.1~~GILI01001687.1.p1  ORF type:complete len:370 (-),score=137.30 GILI01001687.1:215-1324(-)
MSLPYGRVFNFSAGPSALPVEVLEQAQRDMLSWNGCGMSVMEMSHRGKEFTSIANKAEADLRDLLEIPSNYKVLFTQGGATLQFASLPLNLLAGKTQADYAVTGVWSDKAASEAKKYCPTVRRIVDTKSNKYTTIPEVSSWDISPESAYVHYCANETINGVEFHYTPEVGSSTLVADMSSNFCSKPVEVGKHGMIYAGAQKNAGIAGLTIMIVRDDLLGHSQPQTPIVMDYKTLADNESMYNTPPCWPMYMAGLYFDHMKRQGGLAHYAEFNTRKARYIYDVIDSTDFYTCPVAPACRSNMNIPFRIKGGDEALENKFVKEAKDRYNLIELKGHRSVGGLRASVYNGMPEEGAAKLAQFMKEFEQENSA